MGQITPDLEVVQPALQTKADLKSLWMPVGKSWLASYFSNYFLIFNLRLQTLSNETDFFSPSTLLSPASRGV
jgi:hypothetical protein